MHACSFTFQTSICCKRKVKPEFVFFHTSNFKLQFKDDVGWLALKKGKWLLVFCLLDLGWLVFWCSLYIRYYTQCMPRFAARRLGVWIGSVCKTISRSLPISGFGVPEWTPFCSDWSALRSHLVLHYCSLYWLSKESLELISFEPFISCR